MQTFKLVLLTTLIVGYGVALQAGVMPDELAQNNATMETLTDSVEQVADVATKSTKGLWQGVMEFVMLSVILIL